MVKACLQSILCLIVCVAFSGEVLGQSASFQSIETSFDLNRKKALQEKVFLHLDRPAYACGETMWFKLYEVDGTMHKPLALSKVAYVELIDATKKPVLQAKIELQDGAGNGSFVLPATLSSGNYTVRAYTNWMKNFSSDFFYEQSVTIINTFNSPEIQPTKEAAYTVQFFPEGGNMVAGVANKVAFKLVNKSTGEGADLKGEVQDQQGNKIADLVPYKFGIGHFTFTPAAGQKYTATIKLPGNKSLVEQLPEVYREGYTIQLDDTDSDKLKIIVQHSGNTPEQVYLLGHTRQMIAFSEIEAINQGMATFLVDKNVLAAGITHFTVFNADKKPVCERLYFKPPTEKLEVQVSTDKARYGTREKVTLNLLAQANAGNPTSAELSLAVYKLDALQGFPVTNIESYLWLSSDLKGTIENPAYYFSDAGATDREAMDNLMLTHGWSRFKWEDILEQEPVVYSILPEYNGHFINGKVTHKTTGAPAPGITTYLASPGKIINLYNAESDTQGLVRYEVNNFFGARDIIVQSDFTKDSTYHFEIFSPFSDKQATQKLKAITLSADQQQDITARHIQVQSQYAYYNDHINRLGLTGIDSTAFYGEASEQYLLDDFKRFKVMEEVLREYVPGVQVRVRRGKFHFMVFNRPHHSIFQDNPMVLLDGVPVFDIDKIMAFDPLKVKKLDVVTSRFFSGPLAHTGIVSFSTYKGDLAGFGVDSRALLQEYEGLQLKREFFAPAYETQDQKQSRLADFRNLLHWAPSLKVGSKTGEQVSFYTSDQEGTYLIVTQGITGNGLAGSNMVTFKVEQPVF